MRVDSTSYADATERIATWALKGESRTVTVATVNNVRFARQNDLVGSVLTGDGASRASTRDGQN